MAYRSLLTPGGGNSNEELYVSRGVYMKEGPDLILVDDRPGYPSLEGYVNETGHIVLTRADRRFLYLPN